MLFERRRGNFFVGVAWLTFLLGVGLAQFFVGIALSEFAVGLSQFLLFARWQGQHFVELAWSS